MKSESAVWPSKKLRDIADIRVSNVDKKTHSSETPVRLCNYMDVYSNDYVTGKIDFMEASATSAEIDRFGLKVGDVIITKDSETPDDIGIPTVIAEEIGDLVCGYHLALIRPDAHQIDPVYLAKQLSTSQVARYFSLHASGSTRYGLPIGAIEALEILTPPQLEQTKIAEILSTVDRAIEQTEALIAKQQRLKTGLMQNLLTRGIDEHGNLRSEQTHIFKDSPLGRIPVEWEPAQVGNLIAGIEAGWSPSCEDVKPGEGEWGVLKVSAVSAGVFNPSESKRLPITLRPIESLEVRPNDVLISRANGVMELVGRCVFVHQTPRKLMLSDKTLRLNPRLQKIEPFMLSLLLANEDARRQIMNFISGSSGQKNLSQKQIGSIEVALPSVQEQKRIGYVVSKASKQLEYDSATAQKLRALKTALMQDLLTGRKRVTSLLPNTPESKLP